MPAGLKARSAAGHRQMIEVENTRAVWDPQGLDGRHPLPDPDPRQGPNRDEPPRPGLQPQANDHDLRGGTADGGDQALIVSLKPDAPADLNRRLDPLAAKNSA